MAAATRRIALPSLCSLLTRSSPRRSHLEADLPRLIRAISPHRVSSHYFATSSSSSASGSGRKSFARRAIPIVLLGVTGGVFLSAINDLAIFHGCSSKAIEKASQNPKVVEALGEPILRGPWYDASLAVGRGRHNVSCTFSASGPQGTAVFRLKAIRNGENNWLAFLRHHDWDILVMDALLHIPSNEEEDRTLRISILDNVPPSTSTEFKDGRSGDHRSSEKPQPH